MVKETGFRVFGDELGREESYIDVEITGADRAGNIFITEVVSDGSTPEEWTLSNDELQQLFKENLIVGSDDIPVEGHSMWTTLEEIGATRAQVDINNFVDENLRDSAKHLFLALVEAGK
jgi:hypothetical protein